MCMLASGASLWAREPQSVPYMDRVEAEIIDFVPIGNRWALLPFDVVRGEGKPFVGPFTTRGILLVDLQTLQFIGVNTLRDADGDLIFINILGDRLTPTPNPLVFGIDVETRFVGGTRKWFGVRGGFTGSGMLMLPGPGQFVGAVFTGVGNGTITPPRGRR